VYLISGGLFEARVWEIKEQGRVSRHIGELVLTLPGEGVFVASTS
jgi:hypothetical protein